MTNLTPEWFDINETRPPEHGKVLVTNNIAAKTAHGDMAHVWILWPQYCEKDSEFNGINTGYAGEWIGFDGADRRIRGITHWCQIPEPNI